MYIYYDAVDPNTGARVAVQGTGFVVSPRGYVLTASHLLREWKNQSSVDKANNPIKATLRDKVGYVIESPLVLNPINIGDPDQEDVALLKLPDPGVQDYSAANICFQAADATKVGDQVIAFGFPLAQNFQPVPGILGTENAPGARWAAASAFAEGMSGGPVYNVRGSVIGIVKGGLSGAELVRWITPLNFALYFLKIAGLHETCPDNVRPSITVSGVPALDDYCIDIKQVIEASQDSFRNLLGRKLGESRIASVALTGWRDCLVLNADNRDDRQYVCAFGSFDRQEIADDNALVIAKSIKTCLGFAWGLNPTQAFDHSNSYRLVTTNNQTIVTLKPERSRISNSWEVHVYVGP